MTSTLAPLQKPISSRRRRISGSPPTDTTQPLQPMPSLFRPHESTEPVWLQPPKSQAFCILNRSDPQYTGNPYPLEEVYLVETEFQRNSSAARNFGRINNQDLNVTICRDNS